MNFPFRSITASTEFKRVMALPKRGSPSDLSTLLTKKLRTENGIMTLRPIQAQALCELEQCQGLFAPIRVGGGKTLISLLAPVLLQAKRPLLLLPAKLIAKTKAEAEVLSQHWRFGQLKILSYELMGHERGQEELLEYAPDLIIADECHKLKNTKAAVTRRVARYLSRNPNTIVLAMSGTITKRSIRDFWHIAKWCLRSNTPMPLNWPEMSLWADALDEKVPDLMRVKPGVLGHDLQSARQNFQRRFIKTPGVISTMDAFVGPALEFKRVNYKPSLELQIAFRNLRSLWETPDRWPITDAVSMWRHARELACGFYYRWNPRPPEEWLSARKAWASYVRLKIATWGNNLDTELQVAKACTDGRLPPNTYQQWQEIKPIHELSTEAVWIDYSALDLAARWLDNNHDGICWVEHVAFGEALAKQIRCKFYGAGTHLEEASGPVIASISAHSEGRNLQKWNQNLVISCPPSGAIWEQLIGRTHRDGQLANKVTFDILLTCEEQTKGFKQAILDARYIEDMTGQPQKLTGETQWTTFFQESKP